MELEEFEQITEEDLEEGRRMKDVAADREYEIYSGPLAKTPFLIEPFCTQLAWLGKSCPMYPPLHASPKYICKFLTDDNHPNYRCPAIMHLEDFAPIIQDGTPEQKKALETMADMTVRYCISPPDENSAEMLRLNSYYPLAMAREIYSQLKLENKVKLTDNAFDKIGDIEDEN